MAFFDRGNARVYFEETGHGEPIIAVHGLIENTMYWKLVSDIFSKHHRFISMDMRAHGRTVVQGSLMVSMQILLLMISSPLPTT